MKASGNAIVELEGVGKRFGSESAVDGLDLRIRQGEFVTLLGPSGCGKTTTLRCIAGLERPDCGEIRIDGRVVASGSGVYVVPEQRNLGMVFQSYAVWPHMTVFDNVAYGLRVRRTSGPELKRLTMEALELVGLAHLAHRYATRLSGGQRQRVALARAIVYRPKVVLFDEPLSNLDAKLREQMRVELVRLQREVGITSIYVTHDQAEALVMSDRVVVMDHGVVQQIGDPHSVYWQPANTFVARFIGAANLIEAAIVRRQGDACELQAALGPACAPLALRAACRNSVAPGGKVLLCVRPEDLVLHAARPASAESANLLVGDVAEIVYLGSFLECRVTVGVQQLCVQTGHAHRLVPGQRVFLSFDPAHAVCVTD